MGFSIFKRKAAFQYPIDPPPRVAVLVNWFGKPGFRRRSRIRVFSAGWCKEAEAFAPGSIAATRHQLMDLACLGAPLVTHSLIVLGGADDPPLSREDRDGFWRAFGVPVFEQIIGPNGELLAAECEAHDGLHVENRGFESEWKHFRLETGACGCGRTTPRLIAVSRIRFAAQAG